MSHTEAIKGFLYALAPSASDVEDLFHTVFLRVVEKADDFQEGTNFLAWARTIARYEVLHAIRNSARLPRSFSPELIERLAVEAPDYQLDERRVRFLEECIDELSPRPRDAMRRRYWSAQKPAAIASSLNVTRETIYVMLSRARRSLHTCMDRKLSDLDKDK